MLAAKAASAFPLVNTSAKCSILPAPPDAITGIFTISESLANAYTCESILNTIIIH